MMRSEQFSNGRHFETEKTLIFFFIARFDDLLSMVQFFCINSTGKIVLGGGTSRYLPAKPWNKPAETRGKFYFKIAPGSRGFGMNQGQFQMNQGQISKCSSLLQEHKQVRGQRDWFSVVFIMKTSKITCKGKFTAN